MAFRTRHPDDDLVEFLERDQLVADKSRPLPRARLSRRASVALWGLRAFVLIVSAMVIYTFTSQLAG
jgi:4-hydroxybenzoate polyprenyltransferase